MRVWLWNSMQLVNSLDQNRIYQQMILSSFTACTNKLFTVTADKINRRVWTTNRSSNGNTGLNSRISLNPKRWCSTLNTLSTFYLNTQSTLLISQKTHRTLISLSTPTTTTTTMWVKKIFLKRTQRRKLRRWEIWRNI